MIAPAGSTVTRGLVFDQPFQGGFSFGLPLRVSSCLMEPNETSRQETHSFRRPVLLYAQRGTEIEWKTTDPLQKNSAQQVCLEGQRTKKPGIEAVKSVESTVVILCEPVIQVKNGLKNLSRFFSCSRCNFVA
jgi:hypothetical protein